MLDSRPEGDAYRDWSKASHFEMPLVVIDRDRVADRRKMQLADLDTQHRRGYDLLLEGISWRS